ncbi:ankyrin repeat domain-containing protein, partial [bacterium]|nr:ankyrin repeat domain-containing protein [bacterium]
MFLRYFFAAALVFSIVPCKQLTAESLIDAIKSNQVSKASRMITSGTNLSEVDTDGNTALIVAALRNSHLVELLLENGADPSYINQQGFSVLHMLAGRMYIPDEPIYSYYREGFYKTASLILKTGIDIEQRTSRGATPLMLASRAGADDMIRMLVVAGADTELLDESSQTALHYAVAALRPSSVRALIEAGADLNARDGQGRTPLILCSEQQSDPILTAQLARILVAAEAKLDLIDNSGQSTLMKAAQNGNLRMERVLIAAGADQSELNQMRLFMLVKANNFAELESLLKTIGPDARDDQNRTPLMLAIMERNAEMVDFLLKHGADPNSEDSNHQTPIMYAANFRFGRRNLKIVKQLLDAGSKVNIKDSDNSSPLAIAVESVSGEGESIIKILLDAKADPNVTYFQQPILLSAIRKREPTLVDLLLRAGANPNVEYERITPLAIAVQTDQPEMISLLLKHQALDVTMMQQANEILRNYQQRHKEIEKKIDTDISTAEIILKRTSCDGDCPVYSI